MEHEYICQFEDLILLYTSILHNSDTFKDSLIEDPLVELDVRTFMEESLNKLWQRGPTELYGLGIEAKYLWSIRGMLKEFFKHRLPPGHRMTAIKVLDLNGTVVCLAEAR